MLQASRLNRGGKIHREELCKVLSRITSSDVPTESLDKFLDIVFAGRDGEVYVDEFINSLYGPIQNPRVTSTTGLGTPATGLGTVYLAGLKEGQIPFVNRPTDECEPLFDTIDRFREANAGNQELLETLWNRVKVCPKCGKPFAYTLYTCNSCNNSLEKVDISYTENFFTGFMYGVARGKIPYKISIRWQDQDFMCFDDPLVVTPCHLNTIPTSVYVPDLRYLFADPKRGLALVDKLLDVARNACHDQFWGHSRFRETYFGAEERPSPKEVGEFALSGMNFPPSMFQIHLQFIHPPLLPFHLNMFMDGFHFSYKRFFPVDYLQKALALGDSVKMKVDDNTDIEAILDLVKRQGVNYDEYHSALLRKCTTLQHRWSPWKESMFKYQVVNGTMAVPMGQDTPISDVDIKQIQKDDCKMIQSYGRPYGPDDKPSGTYYKFAKKAGDVKHFLA